MESAEGSVGSWEEEWTAGGGLEGFHAREGKKRPHGCGESVPTEASNYMVIPRQRADEMRRWMVCLLPEIIHEMCRVVAVAAAVESI